MVWWQTLLVALASSVVGGVLSVGGSYLLAYRQDRTRQRQDAARIVGAALGALREVAPDVYAERLQLDDDGRAVLARKLARWLSAADGLEVLAALHPGTEIARLCGSVIAKGGLVLVRLDELVKGAALSQAWWDTIPGQHELAVQDARKLALVLHS